MENTNAYDPTLLAKLPKTYLDENIGHRLISVAIASIVLQTVFISLFYISRYLNKTLKGLDCWLFIPIGYIFSIALCICGILIVKWGGAGRHVEAVLLIDPNKLVARNKIAKAAELIDFAAITGSKLAILCLYIRIFTSRPYQIMAYLVGAMMILTWVAAIILSLSICKPISFQWDHSIPGGHCGDIIAAYQFIGVPNILTDFIMLVLPLPALYKLHVNLATKIGLFATFLTGSIGIITSILRLVTFIEASELFKDPTYKCISIFIYTIAEAGTYLIAACMPTLRPLKRRIFPEHSFTKMVDSTLKMLSVKTSKGYSYRPTRKGGVLRTTDIQMDVRKATSEDFNLQTASTTKLNDVGYLMLDVQRSQAPWPGTRRGVV